MSDPRPTEADPDAAGDEPVDADHPGTAAEEAGIVDQQAAVLEEMDEDPR